MPTPLTPTNPTQTTNLAQMQSWRANGMVMGKHQHSRTPTSGSSMVKNMVTNPATPAAPKPTIITQAPSASTTTTLSGKSSNLLGSFTIPGTNINLSI